MIEHGLCRISMFIHWSSSNFSLRISINSWQLSFSASLSFHLVRPFERLRMSDESKDLPDISYLHYARFTWSIADERQQPSDRRSPRQEKKKKEEKIPIRQKLETFFSSRLGSEWELQICRFRHWSDDDHLNGEKYILSGNITSESIHSIMMIRIREFYCSFFFIHLACLNHMWITLFLALTRLI